MENQESWLYLLLQCSKGQDQLGVQFLLWEPSEASLFLPDNPRMMHTRKLNAAKRVVKLTDGVINVAAVTITQGGYVGSPGRHMHSAR